MASYLENNMKNYSCSREDIFLLAALIFMHNAFLRKIS